MGNANNFGSIGVGVSGSDIFPNASILFPMVDERNKRGRPPKKPKPAELE
jgi:hypothetical protein